MTEKTIRAALYLRVSTGEQTTENQEIQLKAAAAAKGWLVTERYEDAGISGTKGRDGRPQLDKMLRDAERGRFDVMMVWSIDRLARSAGDAISILQVLKAAGRNMYIHTQDLDTTTSIGKMIFQMLGVFAEFEAETIRARVKAGIARSMAAGKPHGRPKIDDGRIDEARELLASGVGINRVSRVVGLGNGTVARLAKEMKENPAQALAFASESAA